MREFVDAAHARGMKVYLDIITNHTADVIQYRECPNARLPVPLARRLSVLAQGRAAGRSRSMRASPATACAPRRISRASRDPDYAYTPFVPPAEAERQGARLAEFDPIYYHNRGNSDFWGESSLLGDFVGLDDLMTENPRVVQGFIDIFGDWIERYRVDGFRIDTARHVNPEFWQAFVPAMLKRARASGIPNFHIFGEVAAEGVDVAQLARHTRVDKLPSVLDFGVRRRRAVKPSPAMRAPTVLARLYADDGLYEGGATAALRLPTFTGNHDFGRFAWLVRRARPAGQRRGSPAARDVVQCHVVPAARRAGRLLRRRAGLHRPWHRPGRAPGHVREPGGQLQRPGAC